MKYLKICSAAAAFGMAVMNIQPSFAAGLKFDTTTIAVGLAIEGIQFLGKGKPELKNGLSNNLTFTLRETEHDFDLILSGGAIDGYYGNFDPSKNQYRGGELAFRFDGDFWKGAIRVTEIGCGRLFCVNDQLTVDLIEISHWRETEHPHKDNSGGVFSPDAASVDANKRQRDQDGVFRVRYGPKFTDGFPRGHEQHRDLYKNLQLVATVEDDEPDPEDNILNWKFTLSGDHEAQPAPEPITILGSALALGFGTYFKKQHSKKLKKATVKI